MSQQIIDAYFSELTTVYANEALVSLRDNNGQYSGINIHNNPRSTFTDAQWSSEKNLDDLFVLNDEIKYFIGQLYLHRPFINNPTIEVDRRTFSGQSFATYHQNLYDRRYCTFVSICYEKLYNFWDRLGDLIHSFFPTLITNMSRVDFPRIITALQGSGETDVDYIWLRDVKDNEWNVLNTYRRGVVHYYQFESNFRMEFFEGPPSNPQQMQAIFNDKFAKADYFRDHLRLSCEGCARTYRFLFRVAARP